MEFIIFGIILFLLGFSIGFSALFEKFPCYKCGRIKRLKEHPVGSGVYLCHKCILDKIKQAKRGS
jgi:hypothetical protein